MKYLLVEDSQELADAIISRMRLDGHVIDHAANLEDAGAFVTTGDYDLILLDIMLPDGDGRDFLNTHRRQQDDTPVIVLTAPLSGEAWICSVSVASDSRSMFAPEATVTTPVLVLISKSFSPVPPTIA